MGCHISPYQTLFWSTIVFASFDLWMFKGMADTFALMISYLDESWIPWCVTIRLFEVQETSGNAMVIVFLPLWKMKQKIWDMCF